MPLGQPAAPTLARPQPLPTASSGATGSGRAHPSGLWPRQAGDPRRRCWDPDAAATTETHARPRVARAASASASAAGTSTRPTRLSAAAAGLLRIPLSRLDGAGRSIPGAVANLDAVRLHAITAEVWRLISRGRHAQATLPAAACCTTRSVGGQPIHCPKLDAGDAHACMHAWPCSRKWSSPHTHGSPRSRRRTRPPGSCGRSPAPC